MWSEHGPCRRLGSNRPNMKTIDVRRVGAIVSSNRVCSMPTVARCFQLTVSLATGDKWHGAGCSTLSTEFMHISINHLRFPPLV